MSTRKIKRVLDLFSDITDMNPAHYTVRKALNKEKRMEENKIQHVSVRKNKKKAIAGMFKIDIHVYVCMLCMYNLQGKHRQEALFGINAHLYKETKNMDEMAREQGKNYQVR